MIIECKLLNPPIWFLFTNVLPCHRWISEDGKISENECLQEREPAPDLASNSQHRYPLIIDTRSASMDAHIDELHTENRLEDGVTGKLIKRESSLTYLIPEYYLTWNMVAIFLQILDHAGLTIWERVIMKYPTKLKKLKIISGISWSKNSKERKNLYLR